MAYTDMERRILDMWPKFEDGSYVWFGDAYRDVRRKDTEVDAIMFNCMSIFIEDIEGSSMELNPNERVKRPAPKVLDADGVEIHVGETLYGIGREQHKYEVINPHYIVAEAGEVFTCLCYDCDDGEECHCRPEMLTHTRPDSWERLERDADNGPCGYFDFNGKECTGCPAFGSGKPCISAVCTDLVRRAKALAEKEAGR